MCFVGCRHNGNTDGYHPWDRGFEEACTVDLYDYYNNNAKCNNRNRWVGGWTNERIFDWSINYMERKKNESFAMYVPLMTPHLGKTWYTENEQWHAPEHLITKYRNKGLSDNLSRLYASIDFMDYNIGRLLKRMDELGLSENTVVIFLSDNGPTGNYLMSNDEWWRRNPSGLNGLKGEVKDNGIRVPLFIRWRGRFRSSSVHKAIVSVEDLFPTMMDLAKVDRGDRYLDGKSLTPLLWFPENVEGHWLWRTMFHVEGPPLWTHEHDIYWLVPNRGQDKSALTWGSGGKVAVRNGRYKYTYVDGSQRLYDMWNDPSERNPIWDWDKMREMQGWLEDWWNSMVWEWGTFSTPVYYVGWSSSSIISAMGAVEVSSDLKVRSHKVEGWFSQGSYALYKIIVLRKGCYKAHIVHWGSFDGELGIKVSCGGEGYGSGRITWGGYFAQICLPAEGWEGCTLELSVASGGGWIGFNQIILENL